MSNKRLWTEDFKSKLLEYSPEGLFPNDNVLIGSEIPREYIKNIYLTERRQNPVCFTDQSIAAPVSLAKKILFPLVQTENVLLTPTLRREWILEWRKQSGFSANRRDLSGIDYETLHFRKLYSSTEELNAYLERLEAQTPIRADLKNWVEWIHFYERKLNELKLYDEARLLETATTVLLNPNYELNTDNFPQRILWVSFSELTSREAAFFDALKRYFIVEKWVVSQWLLERIPEWKADSQVQYFSYHTLNDAAEFVADEMIDDQLDPKDVTWVLEDASEIRSVFDRICKERRLPIRTQRDPKLWQKQEAYSFAFLVPQIESGGFERTEVKKWIHSPYVFLGEEKNWRIEASVMLEKSGVFSGMEKYPEIIQLKLSKYFDQSFIKKLTRSQSLEAWLHLLSRYTEFKNQPIFKVIHEEAQKWVQDLIAVNADLSELRFAYEWIEEFQLRFDSVPAPARLLTDERGLNWMRLETFEGTPSGRTYIIGGGIDYWHPSQESRYGFTLEELDQLSGTFLVPSRHQSSLDRLGRMAAWLYSSEDVRFISWKYNYNGSARETVKHKLLNLMPMPDEEVAALSHPRWLRSYRPTEALELGSILLEPRRYQTISASEIENYIRCGFIGLCGYRWKMSRYEDADFEMAADRLGAVKHELVRRRVKEREFRSEHALDGLEEILSEQAERWLRTPRSERALRGELQVVMDRFLEDERIYREKINVLESWLEEDTAAVFEATWGDLRVRFRPDRIDRLEPGWVVIDYKNSAQRNGTSILNEFSRVQLPLYAASLERLQNQPFRPVVGAQYIELYPDGGRAKGIFPGRFAPIPKSASKSKTGPRKFQPQSDADILFPVHVRSGSIIDEDPAEIWIRFSKEIEPYLSRIRQGVYPIQPNLKLSNPDNECYQCDRKDACGKRRARVYNPEELDF